MRIGIFSKFEIAGGSEFRCAELASGLARFSPHQPVLLAERGVPERVSAALDARVEVVTDVFRSPGGPEAFYGLDRLLVVNTDSKHFTSAAYWEGKTERHGVAAELGRLPPLTFLFNFIVSPSRHLAELAARVAHVSIITANSKFFREISDRERYEGVRALPRFLLESPIDPESVAEEKTPSPRLRLGMHSKPLGNKWNSDLPALIERVGRAAPNRVTWDLMGAPGFLRDALAGVSDVTVRREFSEPVGRFLSRLDVFVFFVGWKHEEPWSRSAAEALMSGCPVITTPRGGNRDQVVHGNNGFLCSSLEQFEAGIAALVNERRLLERMSLNARRMARSFSTARVVSKLLECLDCPP